MMAPRSGETNTRVHLANERELWGKKNASRSNDGVFIGGWRCVGEHVCSVPSFHRFIDLVLDSTVDGKNIVVDEVFFFIYSIHESAVATCARPEKGTEAFPSPLCNCNYCTRAPTRSHIPPRFHSTWFDLSSSSSSLALHPPLRLTFASLFTGRD